MATSHPFRSYAQNQEDVVLHRALSSINHGHYLEVGAYHPTIKSTSYAFYERGWQGILIEPQDEFADLCRAIRPRDTTIQSLVGSTESPDTPFYRIRGGARSTMVHTIASLYSQSLTPIVTPMTTLNAILKDTAWARDEFHFMVIDVEGAEGDALKGVDLHTFRPWIIAIESIHPVDLTDSSPEWRQIIESAEYDEVMFDGVSRFFVAREHSQLAALLYPACSTDHYILDVPLQASLHLRSPVSGLDSLQHRRQVVDLALASVEPTLSDVTTTTEFIRQLASLSESALADMEDVTKIIQVAISRARVQKLLQGAPSKNPTQ